MTAPLPTYFISHGGGPWPWVPNMAKEFQPLAASYKEMRTELGTKPKAVLVISGHWESEDFAIMHSPAPDMIYDYHGFPPETYTVSYPAPGAPELAEKSAQMICRAGLPARLDNQAGFDHGTFVPMSVIYPEADVPVFQISMKQGYDPAEHLALGRALAPLRNEGVLIVGSGLSYHNLSKFGPGAKIPSTEFDSWLDTALSLPAKARSEEIIGWEKAPYARVSHAKEDHLVPLFVALGAAESENAVRTYHQKNILGGVTASSYRFGAI